MKVKQTKKDYIDHLEKMIEYDGYSPNYDNPFLEIIPLSEPHRSNIKWLLKGLKYEDSKK